MAARTPKQAMGDAKKRKGIPKAAPLPKLGPTIGPTIGTGPTPGLASLRSWAPKAKAKAISAKAKKMAMGKLK